MVTASLCIIPDQGIYNLDAYIETYNRAIQFAKEFPGTLWCYGKHYVCYQWNMRETGYSPIAAYTELARTREGAVRISTGTAPRERRGGHVCKIAK